MKRCTLCKERKALKEFWKDKSRSDGYCARCKQCERIHHRRKGLKNWKTRRERNKRYYLQHKREILDKRKNYFKSNPEKIIAREAVREAIKKGILIRPQVCERCNQKRRIVAHHSDYLKPLVVEWICSPCHMFHHWGK